MIWPFVSRRAYDILKTQVRDLQERNDRLVEAVSQPQANAPVIMPHTSHELEFSEGWYDNKRPAS